MLCNILILLVTKILEKILDNVDLFTEYPKSIEPVFTHVIFIIYRQKGSLNNSDKFPGKIVLIRES